MELPHSHLICTVSCLYIIDYFLSESNAFYQVDGETFYLEYLDPIQTSHLHSINIQKVHREKLNIHHLNIVFEQG